VPKPLTFVSHELVHFRRYYTWVDLKHFAIQSEMSDRALLAHLIEHMQYHDDYAGEDPTQQSHHSARPLPAGRHHTRRLRTYDGPDGR